MSYVKTNLDGMVRDTDSGAIINTNKSAFELFKAHRNAAAKQKEHQEVVVELQNDVESLKSDISDIKQMLSILIQREK